MALREAQPEPSMEEILASIRRIISEDGPSEGEPVEETTALQAPVEDDLLVFDDVADFVEEDVAAPVEESHFDYAVEEPAPVVAAAPARPAETLISDPAATAAAVAFTRLAGTLRVSDTPGQTLDGMVQEMLRPLLREWLDTHLPKIVEAKVEAELDRISRLAR